MELSKLLEGLGLKGDGKGNADMLRQAENMWKMLDDLAEKDPSSYKQFISKNLESGAEAIKKERENEIKEFTKPLCKDAYKMTLQTTFKLQPLKNVEEMNEFKSVVIDEKTIPTRKYEGVLLVSVFSHQSQPSNLSTSLDHFKVKLNGTSIVFSSSSVFFPSDASGLLSTPMTQPSRQALANTLGRLQASIPIEFKRWQIQQKVPQEDLIEPRLYSCLIAADQLKKLPDGYRDAEGSTQLPKEILLDSVMAAALQKSKNSTKPEDNSSKCETIKEKEIIFKPNPKEFDPPEPVMKEEAKQSGPKIEVISEEMNYEAMILEKKLTTDGIEISIEVDSVESLNEVDLDISSKEIKLYRKTDK